MNIMRGVQNLLIFVSLIACTNSPEFNNNMSSNKEPEAINEKLGLSEIDETLIFRIYGPTLKDIQLIFFDNYDDTKGASHPMTRKANGVWELQLEKSLTTTYYGYQSSAHSGTVIADPYSLAVVRKNNYRYPSKTVILSNSDFDWEGDDFTHTPIQDLVILEAHLRDMSVHTSSGAQEGGTYKGFVESAQRGGIQHVKDMAYNAVEFLPLHEFGNIEIDFKNHDLGIWNDWNPYENNHWGYMTSFFFAPETYYGSDGTAERGVWVGQDGRAVTEMKEMVKALHKQGVSVILDVVYNHVSQYDENPFKLIDKASYFRLDKNGDYLGHSGCGNDFKTENPMSRKMIVESLVYWMEEFHIDGFRFDLATMIDMETVDAITKASQAINPDVLLIGEPWGGGGYNPQELANHGWSSWNDHFRNSVKGRNSDHGDFGFIFGKLWDGKNTEHYKKLMRGYLQDEGGHYKHPSQSVNYLESHDDHTLGDFIRLALGKVKHGEVVKRDQVAKLSEEELRVHKFAALNLLTAQGPVMVAQGQSWGRAKVIANSIGSDPDEGQLDHNSYEKDDETNWLNWDDKELNKELVDYYRGLIAIRAAYPALRNEETGFRSFIDGPNELSFGFQMQSSQSVLVLLNANKGSDAKFTLPEGEWTLVADAESATLEGKTKLKNTASVLPQSGMILVK